MKPDNRLWALGARLWVNKQHYNLILPLPWWPFDKLKVLSPAPGGTEGERKPAVVENLERQVRRGGYLTTDF